MDRIGRLRLPPPIDAVIDVWWLRQYGGGLLLPLRDGTSGRSGHGGQSSYGGGRYELDPATGGDLGGRGGDLVGCLNMMHYPSYRRNGARASPLTRPGSTVR